jgi:hypothetical protein
MASICEFVRVANNTADLKSNTKFGRRWFANTCRPSRARLENAFASEFLDCLFVTFACVLQHINHTHAPHSHHHLPTRRETSKFSKNKCLSFFFFVNLSTLLYKDPSRCRFSRTKRRRFCQFRRRRDHVCLSYHRRCHRGSHH